MSPTPEDRCFLVRLTRTDCAESPQKAVVLLAAVALLLAFMCIANAAAGQINAGHGIDGSTQAVILGLALSVAGLAGFVHHASGSPDGN